MNCDDKQQTMLDLARKIGVPVKEEYNVAALQIQEIQIVDLLPDMLVMVRSLVARKNLTFQRNPITTIDNGLFISFQNVSHDDQVVGNPNQTYFQERPHVRITPSHLESSVDFPEQTQVRQITILIEKDYLKRFLGQDQQRFGYLFDVERTFWIEEFMSPEIAALVDEVTHNGQQLTLTDSFYRLKCLEMLYFLFSNLLRREPVGHEHMSKREIDAIYQVRNAMAASLNKALPVDELTRLSGMNELKLRKLFTQVFGKGLYAYHQHLRMNEAARLLKEEKLSVSETGYRLGFTNLSYFGRLFEKCVGLKPKKWSNQH
jgi:AraC-like DNA-binding protein